MDDKDTPILSMCGFRCDLCPAYYKNIGKLAEPNEISKGWSEYYDFQIAPQSIICVGCRESGKHLDEDCPVRPCVIEKLLKNCAQCDEYVCSKLKSRMESIENIKEKFDNNLTERDYQLFIKPYESRSRLENIRKKRKEPA
jgi:hypothetical protein